MRAIFKFVIKLTTFLCFFILTTLLVVQIFLRTKPFGRLPSGERLEKIKLSKNYNLEKHEFEYPLPTILLGTDTNKESAKGISTRVIKRLYEFLFDKENVENTIPEKKLPSVKTDLRNLDINENLMVWLGHSSLYIQLDGKRILIDPVLERAFPIPFIMKAFEGSDIYRSSDIPEIDILILTHDHWDHINYPTIKNIKNRVKNIIVPLGVGEHLEYWNVDMQKVYEMDWWEKVEIQNLKIHTLPSRHFSGRGLVRNKTLWASFLIETDKYKLFLNGDSGYGPHYKEIGDKFGKIDFVAMEAGQYNKEWSNIHILPEEILYALNDLNNKKFLPIHNSKFKLSKHPWYEPLERLEKLTENKDVEFETPIIGEIIYLNKKNNFKKWWKEYK
ncbi:MAG: MBL fold metallo-hydrolase [Fusobacterium sp.]|uniref:MBL fold metallo-hydrolase n=1 Tax=Fusobacterium sp. TaxID=68766 RepID=UPI0026DBCC6B|nr:MBL fold metallo-hydrolase [Fusobacterium sp.]MDO4691069.1 MBL fold metallo-hydrolase [Fusobacterium sp.]